jgi:2-polyprenyl-6-methoxyphenol hydroxylase-like FAD-dependent oxidoreductase
MSEARVVVVGGGVAGLGAAMLLAADGHEVTVLERNPASPPDAPDEAWNAWDRPGVNQFRMIHLFAARWARIIEAELPAVAERLLELGGLRFDLIDRLPESVTGGRRPGDERFAQLTGRRPVVEAALASVADEMPGLTVRRGAVVTGLLTDGSGVPHVTGVRLEGGEELSTDLVVDAGGRRSPLPGWLAEIGARPPAEEIEDSGFV